MFGYRGEAGFCLSREQETKATGSLPERCPVITRCFITIIIITSPPLPRSLRWLLHLLSSACARELTATGSRFRSQRATAEDVAWRRQIKIFRARSGTRLRGRLAKTTRPGRHYTGEERGKGKTESLLIAAVRVPSGEKKNKKNAGLPGVQSASVAAPASATTVGRTDGIAYLASRKFLHTRRGRRADVADEAICFPHPPPL